MSILRCVIVDDEPEAVEIIKIYVEKTPFLETAFYTNDPLEAFMYLQRHTADVLFLDIEMPSMNGVELAKLLQHTPTKVVFTTAYSHYAVEGFELSAVDYLLKPISFERFLKATQKIYKNHPALVAPPASEPTPVAVAPEAAEDFVLLKTSVRGQLVKLFLKDIIYIESQRNNTIFITDTSQTETIYSLKEIEDKLPKNLFCRVHKSFIISLQKITRFDNAHVYMRTRQNTREGIRETEKPVSIGDSYRGLLQELMQARIIEK